jgi:hypothetical protein
MAISILSASRIASAVLIVFSVVVLALSAHVENSVSVAPVNNLQTRLTRLPGPDVWRLHQELHLCSLHRSFHHRQRNRRRHLPMETTHANLDERHCVLAHLGFLARGFHLGDGLHLRRKVILQ